MVVDQIKTIDQNKDNQIDGKELVDALKSNGFFSKEENLTKVGNFLNSKDIDQSDQKLFSSLEQSFYTIESQIMQKEDITDEDVYILNAYIKVLGGKCEEECGKIQKVIDRHNVQKIMGSSFISEKDVCTLQDYILKPYEEMLDLEKRIKIEDFIERYDIQKLMQECKKKGNMTQSEKGKIIVYFEKLMEEDCDSQDLDTQKKIDEVEKFLSQQNDVIQGIKDIYKSLDQNEQNLLTGILGSGNKDLIEKIDDLLSGDIQLDTEDAIKGVNVLNKLIEKDSYRHGKLKNIVNKKTIEMSSNVNERIAQNAQGNANYYQPGEVSLIQLWANVCYGENLDINGVRGGIRDVRKGTNLNMTNLYIYRLELKTRGDTIKFRKEMNLTEFGNLLNIPNLDAQLSLLPEGSQNKILEKFLDFFLDIKQGGMYFENHIGSENLQIVLNNLINAERYKDTSVEDYYNVYKAYNYEGLTQDEIDQIETEFQEMKAKYQTMGQYFEELATSNMQKMSEDDKNFREYNHQLALSNKINKLYKLYAEILGFKGDESQKQKLKQEFEKIAKEILKNERLTGDQENSIIDMIRSIFSDIPGKGRYHTVEVYYSRGNNPYHKGDIYWNGTHESAPKKIKYTESCYVRVKCEQKSATEANMILKLDGVELNISGKNLNELRNFTHNGVRYDIHYDEGDPTCLIISRVGEGSELQRIFGDDVYQKSQNRQKILYDKREENKETLDISAQVESSDPMQLKSIDWTNTDSTTDYGKKVLDFKSRINDETGYTERYKKYKSITATPPSFTTGAPSVVGASAEPPELPNYLEYHELSIPGCEGKLVHINPKELGKIQKAINKYQKSICFVPRDKKNQKIYELKLSDLKISEKDEKGNIHLYEITSDLNKGTQFQTISADTITDVNNTNGLIMTSINAAPGLQQAMDIVQEISDTMEDINKDYAKFANQEMNEADLREMYQKIIPLLKKIKALNKDYADTFSQLHRGLLAWKTNNASTISRNDESYINSLISNLDYLIGAIGPHSEIGKYCMSMFNEQNVYPNDTATKQILHRFKNNGIKLVSAIAGGVLAVCLIPVTGGASMGVYIKMAISAMIMTAGGMVSGAGGQVLNQVIQRQFTRKVGTIDGEPIYTTYDDPTSLEMAMNGAITRGEFATNTAAQFLIGSATTFGCMYVGSLVGGWLSKAAGSLKQGSIPSKIFDRVIKLNKNFRVPDGDPVTQSMFERMATNIGRNQQSLIVRFNEEFFQELREEASETGFEELGNYLQKTNPKLAMLCSGLSSFAMAWHCLTPGGNIPKVYREQGVTLGARSMDMEYGDKTFGITLEYSGSKDAIVQYYKHNGYNLVNGCLQKESDIDGFTNVIRLRKTNVPMDQRNLAGTLSGYGISIDTETGKGYYQKMSKIQELELSGKVNVSIDPQTKKVTIISGETTIELEQDYFGGKSHIFDVNTYQAFSNSIMMDELVKSINEENKAQKLQELREIIQKQYKDATGNEIQLTDEQVLSAIEAHKQNGILGYLSPIELRNKDQILSETIKDDNMRRFLLEAGFCGSTDYTGKIKSMSKQDVINLIDGKTKIKIENMPMNALNMFMWKACNIGLDFTKVLELKEKINKKIEKMEAGILDKQYTQKLKENVTQMAFEAEIKSIEISDPNFETKIKDIEQRIGTEISNKKILNELQVDIEKRKFEYYKANNKTTEADAVIQKIESLSDDLLSKDITNFKYKRCLLDVELLKIQLHGGSTEILNKKAEELWEDCLCIGGRTDVETLLSKIEAGILLGKPQKELDAYLSFLAIQEYEAGVDIFGSVVVTLTTTFPEYELDLSAKNITDAGKTNNDADLQNKGKIASDNAKKYKEMKQTLEKDKDGRKKLQDKINEFVYEHPISSITDFGNTFSHPLILMNPRVASVEISENTYSKTQEILEGKTEIGGFKIDGGIDMEGKRNPSEFGQYMTEFNEKVDTFLRKIFDTEKLQELNSANHSAGYDANIQAYLNRVGLNDLAQVIQIYGIADCRVHAFSKQILFDTMKRTQLQNLQAQLKTETDPNKRNILEKQIKILKNTKMAYIDSSFTGNVKMKQKYVAEKPYGRFIKGDENVVIEEHTYNLIEIPAIDENGNIIYEEEKDENGNIIYEADGVTPKKKMKRGVYYADSFYQGNMEVVLDEDGNPVLEKDKDGNPIQEVDENGNPKVDKDGNPIRKVMKRNTVYDLSFNLEADISGTIYDRPTKRKKDGEYISDDTTLYMETEVTGVNGEKIKITSQPLNWSAAGRGNTLAPSNVRTEALSDQQVQYQNTQVRENVDGIQTTQKLRSDIQTKMKKSLGKGDFTELKNILKNGVDSDIHYNTATKERETGVGKVKISGIQAIFLERAITICETYSNSTGNVPASMQQSLNVMLDHIVSQDEVDFRIQSGENSDVDERMGVFWDKIQVFNEVYKSKIKEAIAQLDQNDSDSVRNLEKAIEDYQKIYDEDMKGFFEYFRNQIERELEMKKAKRDVDGYEAYDRNNFKHIAERFKNDNEIYVKALKKYEELGMHKQAFELRQQIKTQYNELLSNSQEFLGHFVNFKNIKKELKGPLGREIYGKLISIRNRLEKGVSVDFDEEFGENSDKFRELLGLKGAWSQDIVNEAITKIEESGLANYYEMIGLVHNSEIEQMLTEDAVYGSREKGYYYKQTDGYVSESYDSYKQRMIQNQLFEEGLRKGEKNLGDIGQHLRGLIETNKVLDDTSKGQINTLVSDMMTLVSDMMSEGDMSLSNLEAYKFFKVTTESLIFQSMESDTRSMGDHGVNHILGNIKRLNNYLGSEPTMQADLKKWKFMSYVTHIFHDKGYSALIAQGANHRSGTDLHPFTSKQYFDDIIKPLLGNTGINLTLISQAIESHDGIYLDFSTNENIFLSWVNVSDNMALGLDKVPRLLRHPKIAITMSLLYQWSKYGMDLSEGKKKINEYIDKEVKDKNMSESEGEALKSAVSELNRKSFDGIDFLSIYPEGDVTIGADGIRQINMYKAASIDIAAEICGIKSEELNSLINEGKQAIIEGDTDKIKAITTELATKISKEKFANQITKPLTDYKDNYILANQEGQEYPKVKKEKDGKTYYEYDRNIIAADLLIGRTVNVQKGEKAKDNTDFVESEGTTVVKYLFKENNEIPDGLKKGGFLEIENGMLDYVDGILELEARDQIETIGQARNAIVDLIDAAKKDKLDIDKIEKFNGKVAGIKEPNDTGDYFKKVLAIKQKLANFRTTQLDGHGGVGEPPYSKDDIVTTLTGIKQEMEGLIGDLIIIK